jgi:hypothetical protein
MSDNKNDDQPRRYGKTNALLMMSLSTLLTIPNSNLSNYSSTKDVYELSKKYIRNGLEKMGKLDKIKSMENDKIEIYGDNKYDVRVITFHYNKK